MKRHLFTVLLFVGLAGCATAPQINNPYNNISFYTVDPCTTSSADAPLWCSKTNDQVYFELMQANAAATQRMKNGEDCTDHAQYAMEEARARGYHYYANIYACAFGTRDQCHVALLVDAGSKGRYVMDNGFIFNRSMGYFDAVGLASTYSELLDNKTVIAPDPLTAFEYLKQLDRGKVEANATANSFVAGFVSSPK